MSIENKNSEPNIPPSFSLKEAHFDVEAADKERRDWRLGHKLPTERALGRDEALARENREAVDSVREAQIARQARLDERLGGIASSELRPVDN